MTLDHLRRRLDRIEARRHSIHHCGAVRIITADDADTERQVTALRAAGQLAPGVIVIDRRIVDPDHRSAS